LCAGQQVGVQDIWREKKSARIRGSQKPKHTTGSDVTQVQQIPNKLLKFDNRASRRPVMMYEFFCRESLTLMP
jgi:hypothetical protein